MYFHKNLYTCNYLLYYSVMFPFFGTFIKTNLASIRNFLLSSYDWKITTWLKHIDLQLLPLFWGTFHKLILMLWQTTQTQGFDNSWYHAKTKFNNCFILHFLNNRQNKTFICWKMALGDFRFEYEYEYEIEYENDFSILLCSLHIITIHTHFIPWTTLSA